jgi:hypothetical protein
VTGNGNSPLTVENDTSNYIQMLAPDISESGILFGNPTSSANAGIVYSGSDGDVQFRNANNTTRMRIDSSGRVGIGAAPQSAPYYNNDDPVLTVHKVSGPAILPIVAAANTSSAILHLNQSGNRYWRMSAIYGGQLTFGGKQPGSGAAESEAMRIDQNNALLVGLTSRSWADADLEVVNNARVGNLYLTGQGSDSTISAGNGSFKFSTLTATGGGTGLDFDVNIVVTGAGIVNRFKVDSPTGDTYTNDGTISSLSDIRVKTDINDLTDGLEIVKQLRPVTFKYNDNSTDEDGNGMLAAADDKIRYGFIAQEVEEVAPHYVETSTRKINNEEVDDFKSLSTTRMIPMLFKAIQELNAKLEAAEARIEALET